MGGRDTQEAGAGAGVGVEARVEREQEVVRAVEVAGDVTGDEATAGIWGGVAEADLAAPAGTEINTVVAVAVVEEDVTGAIDPLVRMIGHRVEEKWSKVIPRRL
jgi:hypothetical protein